MEQNLQHQQDPQQPLYQQPLYQQPLYLQPSGESCSSGESYSSISVPGYLSSG